MTTVKGKQLLIKARKLIVHKQNWCQHIFVNSLRKQHCAIGALVAAKRNRKHQDFEYDLFIPAVEKELELLAEFVPEKYWKQDADRHGVPREPVKRYHQVVATYNNNTCHKDVIKMFDKAIENAA